MQVSVYIDTSHDFRSVSERLTSSEPSHFRLGHINNGGRVPKIIPLHTLLLVVIKSLLILVVSPHINVNTPLTKEMSTKEISTP